MDLKTYTKKHGGTARRWCPILRDIAANVGASPETLYMYATGHKKPGALMAIKIDEATKGAVSRRDLRPDIFGPLPKKKAA